MDIREKRHDLINALSIAAGMTRSVIRLLAKETLDRDLICQKLNQSMEALARIEKIMKELIETEKRSDTP
jgi:hypothetical protein